MSLPESRAITSSRTRPRTSVRATLLLTISCSLALCPIRNAHAQQSADYVIGPRDVLSVTVWNQPNLSGKFSVESDGTFTFPLVGRVKAAGLSLHDVEDSLKQLLGDGYFRDPQLSLVVDQYRSQTIYVLGEVRAANRSKETIPGYVNVQNMKPTKLEWPWLSSIDVTARPLTKRLTTVGLSVPPPQTMRTGSM